MRKKLLFAAFPIVCLAGCGPQPLEVWRVSRIEGTKPASCYVGGFAPGSSLHTGAQEDLGTWEIYEGPDDKFFLAGVRLGKADSDGSHSGVTLEGSFDDDRYSFEVTETASNAAVLTPRTERSVLLSTFNLDVDGDTFTGYWREARTYSCSGEGCPASFKEMNPDCTVQHELRGARIDAENFNVVNTQPTAR